MKAEEMIRERADSHGSTRAAFYNGEIPQRAPKSPLRLPKKRQRKKKSMADIADLAMASLEEGPETNSALASDQLNVSADHLMNPHSGNYGAIPEPMNTGRVWPNLSSANAQHQNVGHRHNYGSAARGELNGGHYPSERSLRGSNLVSGSLSSSVGESLRYSAGSINWTGDSSSNRNLPGDSGKETQLFASFARSGYGTPQSIPETFKRTPPTDPEPSNEDLSEEYSTSEEGSYFEKEEPMSFLDQIGDIWTSWLLRHVHEDEATGKHYFEDRYSLAELVRTMLYNPVAPEFTSLQQFNWAVLIGIFMGVFTAFWKSLIEKGLEFVWQTVPEFLLENGIFTDLDGAFPLYHYMWICPAIFSGILSYVFVVLPEKIPDQNAWIENVHSRGVQDSRTFGTLFILSTLGMLSGLSLGPELPLVLTAGMIGSKLGLACSQSMLQARILNLTAAGAAVGGFFGFPMAGALFVLELPHRMGLQYFEALSPATISSIISVLVNRLVVGNDVTGYFSYPFLSPNLPSNIFGNAIVYGLFGAMIGIIYTKVVLKGKAVVHDLFHASHDKEESKNATLSGLLPEKTPLIVTPQDAKGNVGNGASHRVASMRAQAQKLFCCVIPQEKYRAAAAGVVAGIVVGVIGMFVPVSHFWGEAQLQHLIDKGRTPLPVFGSKDQPTGALTALGYCMIDPDDPEAVKHGFGLGCAALIVVAKTVVVGLSLGTGIIFWGPLVVGCAASHLFTDIVNEFSRVFGFGGTLASYPCVVILCTMGSAHVVTFRAHLSIMLILTLTISAFDPDGETSGIGSVAGDYSAVFPLLVVSVFVALMVSRDVVFYKKQRERGDIMAVPEVLCEPGMSGRPVVVGYESEENVLGERSSEDSDFPVSVSSSDFPDGSNVRVVHDSATQRDIDSAFDQKLAVSRATTAARRGLAGKPVDLLIDPVEGANTHRGMITSENDYDESLKFDTTVATDKDPLAGLDELLSRPPLEPKESLKKIRQKHRRALSAPIVAIPPDMRERSRGKAGPSNPFSRDRSNSSSSRFVLNRVMSYGEVQEHQPSLIEQARLRAASGAADSRHRRVPSLKGGRHSRRSSDSSFFGELGRSTITPEKAETSGALSMEDIEQTFNHVLQQQLAPSNASPRPYP